jgi:hypothetical protein
MTAAEGCGGTRDDVVDEAAVAGLGIACIQKIGGLVARRAPFAVS